jgi:hypothetical protein
MRHLECKQVRHLHHGARLVGGQGGADTPPTLLLPITITSSDEDVAIPDQQGRHGHPSSPLLLPSTSSGGSPRMGAAVGSPRRRGCSHVPSSPPPGHPTRFQFLTANCHSHMRTAYKPTGAPTSCALAMQPATAIIMSLIPRFLLSSFICLNRPSPEYTFSEAFSLI